jgi:hypothetical protein
MAPDLSKPGLGDRLGRKALSTGLFSPARDGWYQKCQAKRIFLCRLSNAAGEFPGYVCRIPVQGDGPRRDWVHEEGIHRGGRRGAGLPFLGRMPLCRNRTTGATCRRDRRVGTRHHRDAAGVYTTAATRNGAACQLSTIAAATILSCDRSETRTHWMSFVARHPPAGRGENRSGAEMP